MADQDAAVIQVEKFSRSFGELRVVEGLDLTVSKGEIFGLVGPDGAGKTTTLRVLCGLLDPSSGSVRVAGYQMGGDLDGLAESIGYMPQRFGLYLDLTVEENMLFYADLFDLSGEQLHDLMPRLLRMTRMGPFRDRRAGKLSGGMKQKLGLMCALLHKPRVLFLDEPTNGVDPISRREFWAILYQLVKDGMTVLVTTAYLDEAERCNRVGFMHEGRLIACDSPQGIVSGLEEECYEVSSSNRRKAREKLSAEPGVLSVEPSGSSLHLFLSPGSASVSELMRLLDSEGLGPAEFREMRPSLEDVFIALVRKREAGIGV